MDEYQTIERNGVQELVEARLDEDGTPCVYLSDINAIFPRTQLITSCGAPVIYLCDANGKVKRPLRIPYLENRVLEVHGDDVEQITWSRADIQSSVASPSSTLPSEQVESQDLSHRATTITALDEISMLESGDDDFDNDDDIDDELDDGEREDDEVLDQFEDDNEDHPQQVAVASPIIPSPTLAQPDQSSSTRSPHTPTLQTRPSLPLIVEENVSNSNLPPGFEEALQHRLEPNGGSGSRGHMAFINSERINIPEHEPPPYENFGSSVSAGVTNDEDNQPHLISERISLIKQACQSILKQQYLVTSCPYPPLFILLPVDPMHWSSANIFHNRMALYFLCDAGYHSSAPSMPSIRSDGSSNGHALLDKRNVHIVENSGVELRLEDSNARQFIAKFSHYMLYLLRMLRYGVILDDVFVAAVLNSPTPATDTISSLPSSSSKAQLSGALRDNIGRAIEFLEAYLGDDYDDDKAMGELIRRLSPEDFRVLGQILDDSASSKAAEEAMVMEQQQQRQSPAQYKKDHKRLDEKKEDGGSKNAQAPVNATQNVGLYRTLVSTKHVRWCCSRHYSPKSAMDSTFISRARTVQGTFDPALRSLTLTATSKDSLWTQVMVAMKIKDLALLDLTLNWDIQPSELSTLDRALQSEYTTISSLTLRLGPEAQALTIQSSEGTSANPWPTHPRDQVLNELLGVLKNPRIKSVELEGDIDILQVPQIHIKDLSNLDRLSLMRQSAVEGGRSVAEAMAYHKQLRGLLESCAFLSTIELGFPKIVPGHIRILQVCSCSLTSLRHLDIYRVLHPRVSTTAPKSPSPLGSPNAYSSPLNGEKQQQQPADQTSGDWRKLELSATFRASRVIRLQLLECRTNGDNKADFSESLRELLHDDGSHLEELDLRFVNFSDCHALALEEATRPRQLLGSRVSSSSSSARRKQNLKNNCQLRKLVIHGKGITRQGARALSEVLRRATEPLPKNVQDSEGGDDGDEDAQEATHITPQPQESRLSSPFSTFERPRLAHLEMRSIDSIDDAGWAELVSQLHLSSLITLDLHGFWFGSRALYSLASCEPHASTPSGTPAPAEPPSSVLSTLPLRVLRLNCSTLDRFGVQQFQSWMPRLQHLTTLALFGFRNVDSALWLELLPAIQYRWLERIEFVCNGFDDFCADHIGASIRAREPHLYLDEMDDQPPAYSSVSPSSPTSSTTSLSTTCLTPPSPTRRSFSSASSFFSRSSISLSRSSKEMAESRNDGEAGDSRRSISSREISEREKSHMPLLEIDIRYTDVSRLCLLRLKDKLKFSAQTVRVLLRDEEDEEDYAPADDTRANDSLKEPPSPFKPIGPYATSTAGPPLPLSTLSAAISTMRNNILSSTTTSIPPRARRARVPGRSIRTNSISSVRSDSSTTSTTTTAMAAESTLPTQRPTRSVGNGTDNSHHHGNDANANTSQAPRRSMRFGFLRKE
ncbi:hypothetical protein BGW42_003217 [Actinomortierella wolfii]|nr:hypothetical protein BGW42_003217 [Actinomortierella wolfii]